MRVGIDRPPGRQDPADYVLSDFSAAQRTELPWVVDAAADAVELVVLQGLEAAQRRFHSPDARPGARRRRPAPAPASDARPRLDPPSAAGRGPVVLPAIVPGHPTPGAMNLTGVLSVLLDDPAVAAVAEAAAAPGPRTPLDVVLPPGARPPQRSGALGAPRAKALGVRGGEAPRINDC